MKGSSKRAILILGGTSSIARAVAIVFAEKGYPLYLASRDEEELQRISCDLEIRYRVKVSYGFFDITHFSGHRHFLQQVIQTMDGLEGVILATGFLGDQQQAIRDFGEAEKILNSNFLGACSILTHVANFLEKQRAGFIVGISSVAGDRGRQSNYIYGAAKAGLSVFLQGLRNRLYPFGVHVMTVKPGFVDTAMTFGRQNLFAVASPEFVGKGIVSSLKKGRNEIYIPGFWWGVMWMIKHTPEFIFKRLKL